MIFCVFLDPQSIRRLSGMGELGGDSLIGVLRVLLQSCLLAETTDWRAGAELSDAVKAISNQDVRKRVSALMEELGKRKRFVAILDAGDEDTNVSPAAIALRNRNLQQLDAIISELDQQNPGRGAEVIPVQSFHSSNFAAKCYQANAGLVLKANVVGPPEFFTKHLGKLLLVESSFEIIDRVVGKDFGENYFHNLSWWIDFLRQAESRIELTIHTEGKQIEPIRKRLAELCEDTMISPCVKGYDDGCLPHERYLRTVAFAFNLGRGLDLFDPNTGKNRDLYLAHANPASLRTVNLERRASPT
ncbi:MAG: hypothetical protein KDK99_14855 [Verrucomicrobiales bacterium]|nr:hypothetical protein [Verrucomicrobiales bacterium]